MIVVLSWFGIISVMLALVPVVAISPILLYIGMLIGAQAFQTTPIKHAPAIVLALTPHLAAWGKLQIDTMLGSTINAAQAVGGLAADKVDAVKTAAIAALPQQGVLYHGLEVMGGGSILAGLVLGAIGVFVIEREFNKASAFAFAGAITDLFRLHARRIGWHRGRIGRDARCGAGLCCGRGRIFRGGEVRREHGNHVFRSHVFTPGDPSCSPSRIRSEPPTRRRRARSGSGPPRDGNHCCNCRRASRRHRIACADHRTNLSAYPRPQRPRHFHQPAR